MLFPIQDIVFGLAELKDNDGNVSIEIDVEPFVLTLDDHSENVDTSIRLDSIEMPTSPNELEGKEFMFPMNPNEGYIDGSIYFFAAHNPIDVSKIVFGNISNGRLPITLETQWVLEFEATGFNNLTKSVETSIAL